MPIRHKEWRSRQRGHKVLLLNLLQGLWGIKSERVEFSRVKESENKKMRQSEEMLKLRKKKKHAARRNTLMIAFSRPMSDVTNWTTLTFSWG